MKNTVIAERNPLDWYSLTERTNSILNGLLAYTSREEMNELEKLNPDRKKIGELKALHKEVHQVHNALESYESLERMDEIIAHYAPILKEANKKKVS